MALEPWLPSCMRRLCRTISFLGSSRDGWRVLTRFLHGKFNGIADYLRSNDLVVAILMAVRDDRSLLILGITSRCRNIIAVLVSITLCWATRACCRNQCRMFRLFPTIHVVDVNRLQSCPWCLWLSLRCGQKVLELLLDTSIFLWFRLMGTPSSELGLVPFMRLLVEGFLAELRWEITKRWLRCRIWNVRLLEFEVWSLFHTVQHEVWTLARLQVRIVLITLHRGPNSNWILCRR